MIDINIPKIKGQPKWNVEHRKLKLKYVIIRSKDLIQDVAIPNKIFLVLLFWQDVIVRLLLFF